MRYNRGRWISTTDIIREKRSRAAAIGRDCCIDASSTRIAAHGGRLKYDGSARRLTAGHFRRTSRFSSVLSTMTTPPPATTLAALAQGSRTRVSRHLEQRACSGPDFVTGVAANAGSPKDREFGERGRSVARIDYSRISFILFGQFARPIPVSKRFFRNDLLFYTWRLMEK